MGWLAVSRPVNEAFVRELRALDRSDEWKRFAIAGQMVGELEAQFPDGRGGLGHSYRRNYAGAAEDRRAWLWGFHWKEGGPPPIERPPGACPECWRLGDACREHYRGLSVGELHALARELLPTGLDHNGELQVDLGEGLVAVSNVPFERLQARVAPCETSCEFPGCFVTGCVKRGGS